jgi:TP901 family phage tail tape measure protein
VSIIAGKIKGITITLGADVQPLNKALEDVNKKSRDLQGELRQVERLLKLDPKNTELLAQKQKLLADAVTNSREKLDRLKTAQEQVNEQFRKGEINEEQYRAFQREVVKAEQELSKFEKQLRETGLTAEQVGKKLQDAGQKMTDVGKNLTMKVTAPILGIGAAATKVGMDFEAAMSEVGAISGATGDDLAALEAKAKEMGATTKFSASEAAEGLKYMAMAGWDVQQQLDGLPGVLNLAAAAGEALGTVSDIVTDAMTAFGLEAAQAGEFADVLAAASSSANTNVSMMGETFKYVAPLFGSLGYTVEDASLAVGLMANAGIKGSQSGTVLRGAISRLVKPTGDAAKRIAELGIQITDVEGNMLPFRNVMDQLRVKFANLTAEQQAQYAATIFGQEAMSGMLAIISASEADYNKLSSAIDNSTGAAQRMADEMQDNLQGRLTVLMSSIEGVALQLYDNMKPALDALVASIQKVVEWLGSLSPETQKIIVAIAGVAAAIGPLLVVVGMMSQGIGSIISLFGSASIAAGGLGASLSALAGPIAAAIAAITLIVIAIKDLWQNNEDFRNAVKAIWGDIKNSIAIIVNFLKALWDKHGKHFVNVGKATWEAIQTIISTVTQIIGEIIALFLNVVTGNWEGAWDNIQNIVKVGAEGVKKLITGLGTALGEIFTGLINSALNWGRNLLQSFIDGIKEKWSVLLDTVRNIADTVADYLGFSSPTKKGPGRFIEEWGANMVKAFADGMNKELASLQTSLGNMALGFSPVLAGGGASAVYTYNNDNRVINITVQDGEDLLRTLHRLGVRIP